MEIMNTINSRGNQSKQALKINQLTMFINKYKFNCVAKNKY